MKKKKDYTNANAKKDMKMYQKPESVKMQKSTEHPASSSLQSYSDSLTAQTSAGKLIKSGRVREL